MKFTIEQIKKLRVDALYGKKKHFNAADRKYRYRLWVTMPVIIINVLIGSTLFSILQESSPYYVKVSLAILSIFAAILTGLSAFLDFAKQVEGHRRVGNKYLAVVKGCERLIACYKDNLMKPEEIVKKLEQIACDCDEANKEAEAFNINDKDYKRAQKSIQAGDESYLAVEMKK